VFQIYGIILWNNVNDNGYGRILLYLAKVEDESLRRMFNEKNYECDLKLRIEF
jgi:hypothetical protein